MEEVGQNSLNDVCKIMEIPNLEVTKQNLDYLNSDLEQDLQKLDEANQILLRKIQEKEETIQSLEAEISMSLEQIKEKEELEHIASEKEESLKDLELQSGKLEKKNKLLNRNITELQKEISSRFQNVGPDQGTLKQNLTELKVKVQKSAESCAKQEKKLAKAESDYLSVYQLCEDQAHYIKKYQEILRQMEKEKEVLLLEKEISKVQSNSSHIVKSGSILVETIQSNMDLCENIVSSNCASITPPPPQEKTIMRKQKRIFWYRNFQCLVFMAMIFIRLLGYMFFHLQYINPDLFVDALPMVMSRDTLTRLRDVLFPSLTLEVEEVLPH
ncbi:transmembrane and coiled-coil domain-containing protein 5B-like isoform X1 [Ochotona princeps]|uniref:transmembrane and coiled-coil domain-containing protein 5B-like isoform X1 n=1 Tax=Ochotona princeps TaxID=9978 RepID=UPI0027147F02|nr:transmembrane and coiled-coil domain-containing protein 5B-like isoform X1 [Ochotona princeps]